MLPYNFTGNNPIMLVDPDGRSIDRDEQTAEYLMDGYASTLGANRPFYMEGGKVKYREFDRNHFNESQLDIID